METTAAQLTCAKDQDQKQREEAERLRQEKTNLEERLVKMEQQATQVNAAEMVILKFTNPLFSHTLFADFDRSQVRFEQERACRGTTSTKEKDPAAREVRSDMHRSRSSDRSRERGADRSSDRGADRSSERGADRRASVADAGKSRVWC